MAYLTERLSDEDRAYWEEVAKAAIPYTEEEEENIKLDDPMMETEKEFARSHAYIALKILAEDDELRRKEKQEKNKS